MIDGYIKPPLGTDQSRGHMENWQGPIRRSYNSEMSTVDYTVIGPDLPDVVPEIGILDYSYFNEKLVLEVSVRLVYPRTKGDWAGQRAVPLRRPGRLLLCYLTMGRA